MILCVCPNPAIDTYLWLNEFSPGKPGRIQKEQRFPGGKGVHVALALRELGEEAAVLGFWGGPTGAWIKDQCEMRGIACYGPETKEWTRTCFTIRADGVYDHTELLGPGPTIDAEDFENFRRTFAGLINRSDAVTMSGSWPAAAPTDAYARLIKQASQSGKKVFLDCTGEGLIAALAERPYLVHLNQHEAAGLFGNGDVSHAALMLARQCEYAAITAGAEGLFLGYREELLHAQCPVEKVYSTVGSGDCLLAGLAFASMRGANPAAMATWGVACGAANCMREELGMLHKKDVETAKQRVSIKEHDFLA